jgi:hypothetical protein
MDFSEVLTKAWRIVWKHKILWIFGILAGCGTGGGGGGGGSSGTRWQQGTPFSSGGTGEMERYLRGAGQWISEHWWVVALGILALLVLWALAVFLGTIGRIGLIRGTFSVDGGAEKLRFGELFRESMPYFWRVFLLTFLIGLAFLIVFLPLVLFGILTAGVGFLCLIPLLCVLVPLLWAVGIVVHQANSAIVVEDLGLLAGLRRGWEVFKKNIGPMLLIWVITGVIGFVIGLVIALPMLIIVVPTVIGFATSGGDLPTTALLISGLCFVVYLPVLLAAQGILAAYVQSVWTLTFLRLTRPGQDMVVPAPAPANA